MNIKRFFTWIFFLATTMLLSGCSAFRSLELVSLDNWDLVPKSLATSRLSAVVKVFNPNPGRITVKNIRADIRVKNKSLGMYTLDSSFKIPGRDTFSLPISLDVNNAQLLGGLLNVATGGEIPYELKGSIRGAYKSITADVPFEHKGRFSEKDIRL